MPAKAPRHDEELFGSTSLTTPVKVDDELESTDSANSNAPQDDPASFDIGNITVQDLEAGDAKISEDKELPREETLLQNTDTGESLDEDKSSEETPSNEETSEEASVDDELTIEEDEASAEDAPNAGKSNEEPTKDNTDEENPENSEQESNTSVKEYISSDCHVEEKTPTAEEATTTPQNKTVVPEQAPEQEGAEEKETHETSPEPSTPRPSSEAERSHRDTSHTFPVSNPRLRAEKPPFTRKKDPNEPRKRNRFITAFATLGRFLIVLLGATLIATPLPWLLSRAITGEFIHEFALIPLIMSVTFGIPLAMLLFLTSLIRNKPLVRFREED